MNITTASQFKEAKRKLKTHGDLSQLLNDTTTEILQQFCQCYADMQNFFETTAADEFIYAVVLNELQWREDKVKGNMQD